MKYYHMIIENVKTGERREYISPRQGATLPGYRCIGVCGYHEQPKKTENR